jgi:predicted RNase H-like nuclease
MVTHLGVDACSGGWFATIVVDDDIDTECYPTFDALWATHANADRILVDIPIGLPDEGTRVCDAEARTLLGCRGSSVFDTLCRPLLNVADYDEANATYRELAGKGLSQQAWHLREKIEQVDTVVRQDERAETTLRESHPELCFYALNDGNPVAYSKKSERGQEKRLAILESELADAEGVYDDSMDRFLRKHVGRDDILDACALAVAARNGSLTHIPEASNRGDPWMRIYYPNR